MYWYLFSFILCIYYWWLDKLISYHKNISNLVVLTDVVLFIYLFIYLLYIYQTECKGVALEIRWRKLLCARDENIILRVSFKITLRPIFDDSGHYRINLTLINNIE